MFLLLLEAGVVVPCLPINRTIVRRLLEDAQSPRCKMPRTKDASVQTLDVAVIVCLRLWVDWTNFTALSDRQVGRQPQKVPLGTHAKSNRV